MNNDEMKPEHTCVLWFGDQMMRKLREKQATKGGRKNWLNEKEDWLLARLEEEFLELRHAVQRGLPSETVIREAADVANFAMMLADKEAVISELRELNATPEPETSNPEPPPQACCSNPDWLERIVGGHKTFTCKYCGFWWGPQTNISINDAASVWRNFNALKP